MTLTPRFLLVLSLFQISLGLGWILGYVFLPPTIFCYERAAERSLAGEYRTVRPEGLNAESSIVLQPYDYFNKGQTAQLPVVSLHRESSLNSFAAYPPNPMDYTVLFRHLYEQGARNVYVMAPMAWEEEPDSIVKAAVAEKALPQCNLVCITGVDMKVAVGGYLQTLYDLKTEAVGGAMPGDGFYWMGA